MRHSHKVSRFKLKNIYFGFDKAVRLMLKGFRVQHFTWAKDDYIFISEGIIYNDGGFEYFEYITSELLSSNKWQIYKNHN